MNLMHLSFIGAMKSHHAPPVPPTPEERLSAFRAIYPKIPVNNYSWKWLDDIAPAQASHETLRSIDAMLLSRDMLNRIADDTRNANAQPASQKQAVRPNHRKFAA